MPEKSPTRPTHLPQSVWLTADWLLLSEPRLGAPVSAYCDAGTRFAPKEYQNGFYYVSFQSQHGYIPVALCAVESQPAQPRARELICVNLLANSLLWPWCAEALPVEPIVLTHTETVHVLGKTGDWYLVQRENGMVGFFLPQGPVHTFYQAEQIGCIGDSLWVLLGIVWGVINWLVLQGFLVRLQWFHSPWLERLEWILFCTLMIMMWRGKPGAAEQTFVIGVSFIVIMLGVMVIAMISF